MESVEDETDESARRTPRFSLSFSPVRKTQMVGRADCSTLRAGVKEESLNITLHHADFRDLSAMLVDTTCCRSLLAVLYTPQLQANVSWRLWDHDDLVGFSEVMSDDGPRLMRKHAARRKNASQVSVEA